MSTTKMGYRKKKVYDIYSSSILSRKVSLPMKNIGSTIKTVLQDKLKTENEGKCIEEGFIKPDSVEIIKYSSGKLESDQVIFDVSFKCLICCPVEGMNINCVVINITKAGIRAQTNDEISPVDIFIARDHNYQDKYFSEINEEENIIVKVIGQKYELYDPKISIIAELVPKKQTKKPKLILED